MENIGVHGPGYDRAVGGMGMADNREKLYILCGLAGKGEDDIRNALTEKAEVAGYEAV